MACIPACGSTVFAVALALAAKRRGPIHDWAQEPRAVLWACSSSLLLWMLFEFFNKHLPVWSYGGFPASEIERYLTQGMLHATILPLMLGVAALLAPIRCIEDEQPLPSARRWPRFAALVSLAALAAAWLLSFELSAPAFLLAVSASALLADSRNAAAGRISFVEDLRRKYWRRPLAWSIAAASWLAFMTLLETLGPARRLPIAFSGPPLPFLLWFSVVALGPLYVWLTAVAEQPRIEIDSEPIDEPPASRPEPS